MTKADELWEKYSDEEDIDGFPCEIMCKKDFLAAIKEYGEHVRAEAVKVCNEEKETHVMSKYVREGDCLNARDVAKRCAAAIEKMEIK